MQDGASVARTDGESFPYPVAEPAPDECHLWKQPGLRMRVAAMSARRRRCSTGTHRASDGPSHAGRLTRPRPMICVRRSGSGRSGRSPSSGETRTSGPGSTPSLGTWPSGGAAPAPVAMRSSPPTPLPRPPAPSRSSCGSTSSVPSGRCPPECGRSYGSTTLKAGGTPTSPPRWGSRRAPRRVSCSRPGRR
jgi:hypothetical protein